MTSTLPDVEAETTLASATLGGDTQSMKERIALALFMAVLVYIRHADNIRRLLKGQEPRIGRKAGKAE